jgi:hypothetical protein
MAAWNLANPLKGACWLSWFYRDKLAEHRIDVICHGAERLRDLLGGMLMGIKMAAVVALGAPAEAVLVFEVLLNATALFNHSNVVLPLWLDRALRLVLVTPDMHRVHHSVVRAETDSNFGFCLSVWDRIFGTHIPEPAARQLGMVIGIDGRDISEHLPALDALAERREAGIAWLQPPVLARLHPARGIRVRHQGADHAQRCRGLAILGQQGAHTKQAL